jgi:hypothetical protein
MRAKMWVLLVFTSSLIIHLISAVGDGEGTSNVLDSVSPLYVFIYCIPESR